MTAIDVSVSLFIVEFVWARLIGVSVNVARHVRRHLEDLGKRDMRGDLLVHFVRLLESFQMEAANDGQLVHGELLFRLDLRLAVRAVEAREGLGQGEPG